MFTSSPHLLLSCFYRWSLASWKTWSLLRSAVGKAPVSKDIIQPHVHVSGAGLNAEASELLLFHVSCLYGDQRGIRGKKRGIHSNQESLFPRKKKICASLYCIQINESWSECYNKNKLAKLTQMFTSKTKKKHASFIIFANPCTSVTAVTTCSIKVNCWTMLQLPKKEKKRNKFPERAH